MLLLLYLVVRVLARLLGASGEDDHAKDLEILVLRHQLRVLQRTSGPPKFRAIDRKDLQSAATIAGCYGSATSAASAGVAPLLRKRDAPHCGSAPESGTRRMRVYPFRLRE